MPTFRQLTDEEARKVEKIARKAIDLAPYKEALETAPRDVWCAVTPDPENGETFAVVRRSITKAKNALGLIVRTKKDKTEGSEVLFFKVPSNQTAPEAGKTKAASRKRKDQVPPDEVPADEAAG